MNSKSKLALVSLIAVCIIIADVRGQDASDFPGLVLDISRTSNGGSARILGLGGAQTALGGDISSISSNPAGLGFFNRSEFSFSTQFNGLDATSNYTDNRNEASKFNFNLPNLGVVINRGRARDKWRNQSFGVSINRKADFQNQFNYSGLSFNETVINPNTGNPELSFDPNAPKDIIELAFQGVIDVGQTIDDPPVVSNDFAGDLALLAWRTFILDEFTDDQGQRFLDRAVFATDDDGRLLEDSSGNLIMAFPEENLPTLQIEDIDIRGAAYEFNLAYGANYDDRIYLGASLGINTFRKEVERIYSERPTNTDLISLTFTDQYEQTGLGINATAGIIARPVDVLLIGLSYTSPTFYGISQIRELGMTANFIDVDRPIEAEPLRFDESNFGLTIPSTLNAGLTFFAGKNGFITAEVEQVNYREGRVSGLSEQRLEDESNADIDRFNRTLNYRIGAEFRHDIFRVRGGFAYIEDPESNRLEQDEKQFSFGLGIRQKKYYGDIAVMRSTGFATRVSPYPGASIATIDQNATRVTLTVGVKF
ncbi:MAG: hypothetical protein AAF843_06865 [Bacteroidota bacterium]